MVKEKEFLEKMMADDELRAKVEAADPDQIAKIASEAGFDIDVSELEKEVKKTRSNANTGAVELSEDDMDKAAGGRLWCGEDGPDGHELGCALIYHDEGYQLRHKIYCKENYFCIEDAYEGDGMVG